MLALVVRDPRREHFLQRGETAGRQHLRAQRVALELLEVGLQKLHVRQHRVVFRTFRARRTLGEWV